MAPVFLTSRKKVIEQYNTLTSLGCTVSYSHKTNKVVWSILEKDTDCQVHCHTIESVEEIKDKTRIWFFTLALSRDILRKIIGLGVNRFIVDNPLDLDTLISYIEKHNITIDLLLRMKVKENTVFTGKYFVYGMNSGFVNEKLLELRQNPHIRKIGIHFHRKTQNVSEWSLAEEMEDAIRPEVLSIIDILDIGGGIPGLYKSSHDRSLERIFGKIRELREWLPSRIDLIVEPGRFIAGPSTNLTCHIIAIYENTIFVDCSIYNGALDTVIANVRLLVMNELPEGQGQDYTIKGCTPDSMDILRYKVYLDDPHVGDEITFLNAGAYTYSTDFCDLKKIENLIVD